VRKTTAHSAKQRSQEEYCVRSSFVSISIWLRAFRFRNHVVSSSAALAILLGPGTLQAQYISYAGTQTVFPLTGVVEPIAIAVDARGNRYIVDNESANLTEVSVGGVESTINSTLSGPNGIAVDAAGNLYVADSGNNRVLEIAAGGGAQTTVPITGLNRPVSVAVDSLDNLYVVDYRNQRVLQIAAGGGQTVVAPTYLSQPTAVAVDSYNNVYITDKGDNSLVEVPASGATPFYAQNNTLPSQPNGVAVDKFGNVFVASLSGYFTLYAGGGLVRPLGTGWQAPAGVATDSSGNVYVVDENAGLVDVLVPGAVDIGQANVCPSSGTQTPPCGQSVTLNYNVEAASQNITSVAVKVATQGAENLDYTATANTCTGDFTTNTTCAITVNFAPTAPGVRMGAVDVVGTVAPSGDVVHRQQKKPRARPNFILPSGATELSTVYVHGLGVGPLASFDAGIISTLSNAFLSGNYLTGIRTDSSGNIYAADNGQCVVYEFTPPNTTAVIAGSGSCGPESGDGGAATSATFSRLWGIAVDSRGDLFISDPANSVIREVDGITGIIDTIAGIAGSRGHTPDGALAIAATLTDASGMAVDGAGNLYYADGRENLVRRIDASSGILTTVAGNYAAGAGYSGDGSLATSAQMYFPLTLAIDSAGNLYIADDGNNVIRKVDAATGIITTAAGQGPPAIAGYAGDGGPATSALLDDPEGVGVDAAGNIYIADSSNLLIRKINVHSGIITTAAGVYSDGVETYTGDGGAATLAGLSYMQDVTVDPGGNIIIADSDNSAIRKVTAASGIAAFGSFAVGSSSPAIDVTLTNDGNSEIDLSALLASANFNLSGSDTSCTASSALTPGESCILGIEFLPTTTGSLTGTITATDNVGNNATSTQSVALSGTGTAPVATQLALSGVPGTVQFGGNLGTVQVSVETSGGAVVTDSSASITVTITGPNEYSQQVTVSAVAGVATFNLSSLAFSTAGGYTITATSSGLTQASASFTVTAAPATMLALSTIPPTVALGGNLGTVQVSVETSGGAVVTSSTASITVTITGPNEYSQQVTISAVAGVATFNLSSLTFSTAGSYTITATSSGLTQASASFTVTAAPATMLALSTIPATVAQDGNLGTVQVSVETSGGAIVTGSTASITVTVTGPGSYSQQVTVSAVNGVATFNLSSFTFSTAGSYTITATSSGLTQASASFTVTTTVQAASLALSTIPATVAQGGNLGTVQVSVETSGGAVVTSSTASITVTITGPNEYSQQVTVTAVNGVASFDLTSFTFAAVGSYTITASSSGLTSGVATFTIGQNFTLTPSGGTGTPNRVVLPGAAAVYQLQLAPAGTTFSAPITLSATGLPPGATYTFNPPVVTPGTAAATTTLTVDTAKATASLRSEHNMLWGVAVFLPAAFLLPWPVSGNRRRKARWFPAMPLLLLGLSLGIAVLSGCGAGGLFGQPQATYTVTVTGTSGALTHSTTVTLTVQ
jgi:sugar lactone lactonase YvrE